jgi:RND family efflux transporter MFP subunit
MHDQRALLNQLRVDRSTDRRIPGWAIWLSLAIMALIISLGAWFALAARAGTPVHVAVAKPALGALSDGGAPALEATGYIVAQRQSTVSAKTTGRVLQLLVDEGQTVVRDQILARLDDSNTRLALQQASAQLEQASANVQSARVAAQDAVPIYRRTEELHAQGIVSDDALDVAKTTYNSVNNSLAVAERSEEVARANLAAAQQNQEDTIIRAPFAGVITVKAAQPGDMVSPISAGGGFIRTGICTIVDMDSLDAEADVSENFIHRIRPHQPVNITLNAYPDWRIPGEIKAVIPTADRAKATVKVRVGFKVKDPRILPEMGVRVSVLNEPAATTGVGALPSSAVLVPPESVQADGEKGVVLVVNADVVERRAVLLGARSSDGQLILSGLSPGSKVVVGPLNLFSNGEKVRVEP